MMLINLGRLAFRCLTFLCVPAVVLTLYFTAKVDGGRRLPRVTFHAAAAAGQVEAVRSMLDAGADVASRDELGVTPLFRAVAGGDLRVVNLLLTRGADVNSVDPHGRTVLQSAIIHGHDDISLLLLSRGADGRMADRMGRTPLHWAAATGRERIVQTLADKGDADVRDDDGYTPSQLAVQARQAAAGDVLRRAAGLPSGRRGR